MTRDEAIKKLEVFEPMVVDDTREALDMAIEALKERAMTRNEAIEVITDYLNKDTAINPYNSGFINALDMAIEALDERKVELFDDGTLVVNVKEGEKVGRVLIEGDDHFGGLYYIDSGEGGEE